MQICKIKLCVAICVVLLPARMISQVLETEESKPLKPHQFEVGAGLEFQTSAEGTETALPIAVEYGLSKKFTLLVEPVPYTSINPKSGMSATGVGDLEVTLFYQIVSERKILPSISISGEVKIPTAKNQLIGTGKTDYSPFLIMSKTTGPFFTSLNLSYTFLGKPKGVDVANLFNYALGTIYTTSPHSIIFGEVYGNTSAAGGAESPDGTSTSTSTELAGGETVGAVGYGYYLHDNMLLSMGISYDNNNAILFRPGIEWKFGGKKNDLKNTKTSTQ